VKDATMKIYIMTDQEGVAGVLNAAGFNKPGALYYEDARELTTLEANAAIEGALEAGATEFFVVDGHGYGSIQPKLLHPAATLLAGSPMRYPFGCDSSFDAAFIIGQHAKSNADGGHLSHTGSFEANELTINNHSLGELGQNMLFCAYFGVPTVLVTGDHACSEEAKAVVPEVETVTVKWGEKRGSAAGLTGEENSLFNGVAAHRSPLKARELIREGARRAIERREKIEPFWLEPPYEMVLTLRHSATAGARRATRRHNDLIELFKAPYDIKPIRKPRGHNQPPRP
jgi:D-amino peptidase